MKRAILAAVLFLGAVGSLTACGTSASPATPTPTLSWAMDAAGNGGDVYSLKFETTNARGESVICVYAAVRGSGGPSCDWDHPVAK